MDKRNAFCYWDNPVTKKRFFGMLEVDNETDIYKTVEIDSLFFLVPAIIISKEIDKRVPKI